MTGGGGSSFARGIFLCLNLGGSRGSSATVDILMIRCLPSSEVEAGVYRMYSEAALSLRVTVEGRAAAILPEVMDSRARRVRSAVDMTADSEGRSRDLSLRSSRLARGTRSGTSRRKSQLVYRGPCLSDDWHAKTHLERCCAPSDPLSDRTERSHRTSRSPARLPGERAFLQSCPSNVQVTDEDTQTRPNQNGRSRATGLADVSQPKARDNSLDGVKCASFTFFLPISKGYCATQHSG